jgi:hypothetical protein
MADRGDFLASAQLMGANKRLLEASPEFFLRNRSSGESDLDRALEEDVRRQSIEDLGEEEYERAIRVGESLSTSQFMDLALGRSKATI